MIKTAHWVAGVWLLTIILLFRVLEGLNAYIKDYTYVQGPKIFDDHTDFIHHVTLKDDPAGIDKAVEAAKNAKVVGYGLGRTWFYER